jgi:hypothetical protein
MSIDKFISTQAKYYYYFKRIKTRITPLNMEKGYKTVVVLFIAITIIVLIGFYKTYFPYFPEFEQFKTLHHIHGLAMMLWLVILIVQPVLIRSRKYR